MSGVQWVVCDIVFTGMGCTVQLTTNSNAPSCWEGKKEWTWTLLFGGERWRDRGREGGRESKREREGERILEEGGEEV